LSNFTLFQGEPRVIQVEIVLILSLLLITGIALFVRRFRFPYTVALVLAGLLLAFASNALALTPQNVSGLITSELILAILVPPLVFEGALFISWRTFQNNLLPILLMSVVGVALGTLIVAGLMVGEVNIIGILGERFEIPSLVNLIGLPLAAAIAFGALISATDPVAVIAFFRSLGVEKRLSILVEGESLLNDGVSIVIFQLALVIGGASALVHGSLDAPTFNFWSALWQFTRVSIGGVIVGLIIGKLADLLLERTDNRLVETTLTMPAAFGAYLLAEQLHLSGILSVVACGIFLGNNIPRHTTPTTKIALYNYWEVLSFIVTSLIFLIIGSLIDISQFFTIQNLVLVLAAVIAILVARLIVVYGMSAVANFGAPIINKILKTTTRMEPIPSSYQHVMFWGGLRGAISLALALSLSPNTFGPGIGEQIRLMTFGVVLFTLLVQGTTIERLIKRLGLAHKSQAQIEKERQLGRYFIARAARNELNRLHDMGIVSGSLWQAIQEAQQAEIDERDQAVRDMMHRYPEMGVELALQARRLALQAERTAIQEAASREIISEEIQEELAEELDARLAAVDVIARQADRTQILDEEEAEEGGA
jgi:CPA1 family monovalent cation:H+ antiporter